MPMVCEPTVNYCLCFDQRTQDALEIYLLATWVNGGTPAPTEFGFLLQDQADSGGYILLDDGGRIAIQI